MSGLTEKVIETIKREQLIEKGDKIVLAVSGGPDSIAMLNVLNNIIKTEELVNQTRNH